MFYTTAIALAFFLAFILFTKRNKTNSDRLLGVWLIMIGIHLSTYYIGKTIPPYYYPYLLVTYPFPLLHGPFLYLYTASLTQQSPLFKKQWYLHFAPFILFYFLMIPFFMKSHPERLAVFENKGQGFIWVMLLHKFFVFASGALYVVLSLQLLQKHKHHLKANFSEVEKINLSWLRYLIYEVALVWLAVFYGNDHLIFTLVAIFVIFLGYFGIKQVGIFTQNSTISHSDEKSKTSEKIPHKQTTETETSKTKYEKSALTPETINTIHQRLLLAINEQQMYLNPELTLTELSYAIGATANHVSQVINSVEEKTFYDFINGKRIETFKKRALLPENQKYTILSLAFECGFNSKTAFYRNFKNLTGQSPSDYLNQHKIQMQADLQ